MQPQLAGACLPLRPQEPRYEHEAEIVFLPFNVLEYSFALGREPCTLAFCDMSSKSTLEEVRCYLRAEPGSLSGLKDVTDFVGNPVRVCIPRKVAPAPEKDGRRTIVASLAQPWFRKLGADVTQLGQDASVPGSLCGGGREVCPQPPSPGLC